MSQRKPTKTRKCAKKQHQQKIPKKQHVQEIAKSDKSGCSILAADMFCNDFDFQTAGGLNYSGTRNRLGEENSDTTHTSQKPHVIFSYWNEHAHYKVGPYQLHVELQPLSKSGTGVIASISGVHVTLLITSFSAHLVGILKNRQSCPLNVGGKALTFLEYHLMTIISPPKHQASGNVVGTLPNGLHFHGL